jgi:hypothetical protein
MKQMQKLNPQFPSPIQGELYDSLVLQQICNPNTFNIKSWEGFDSIDPIGTIPRNNETRIYRIESVPGFDIKCVRVSASKHFGSLGIAYFIPRLTMGRFKQNIKYSPSSNILKRLGLNNQNVNA